MYTHTHMKNCFFYEMSVNTLKPSKCALQCNWFDFRSSDKVAEVVYSSQANECFIARNFLLFFGWGRNRSPTSSKYIQIPTKYLLESIYKQMNNCSILQITSSTNASFPFINRKVPIERTLKSNQLSYIQVSSRFSRPFSIKRHSINAFRNY